MDTESPFVIDPAGTPLLERRMALAPNLEERLFLLMTLADDRAVFRTYVGGELVHAR